VLDPDIPLTRGNNSVTQLAAVQTVTGVVFSAALKDAQKARVRKILDHLKVGVVLSHSFLLYRIALPCIALY
jgi:hypothetical protein